MQLFKSIMFSVLLGIVAFSIGIGIGAIYRYFVPIEIVYVTIGDE